MFQRGPCFPEFLPPIGQDLRLTIVSTDENDPTNKKTGDTDQKAGDTKGGEDLAKKSEDAETHDGRSCARYDPRDVCRAPRVLGAAAEG